MKRLDMFKAHARAQWDEICFEVAPVKVSKSRKEIWCPRFFQKTNEAHYPKYRSFIHTHESNYTGVLKVLRIVSFVRFLEESRML